MKKYLKLCIVFFLCLMCVPLVSCGKKTQTTSTTISVKDSEKKDIDGVGSAFFVKIPSNQYVFKFFEYVSISNDTDWIVSSDISGNNPIPSKTVHVNSGESKLYYVALTDNSGKKQLYYILIYRRVTFNVYFDSDGGSYCETKTVEEDGMLTDIPTPKKEGYTFSGWDYPFETQKISETVRAKAKWTSNVYQINYDANGGSAGAIAKQVYYGNYLSNPIIEREGYIFKGWFDENESELKDGIFEIPQDLTVKAKWEKINYKITYNLCGGNVDEQLKSSFTIETPTFSIPYAEKFGCEFLGWKNNFGEIKKDYFIETGSVGDLILTAVFSEKKYHITLDTNSGDELENNRFDLNFDEFSNLPIPTKRGYEFVCWCLDKDGKVNISNLDKETNVVTFYAKWKAVEYTITYNLGGGTNTNLNTFTIENLPIRLADPSLTDTEFLGWTTADSQKITEITTLQNYILNANWGLTYTISEDKTFYTVSGSHCKLQNIEIKNEYKNVPVTAISLNGFKNLTNLQSILIPDSITTFGNSAFSGCSSLTSVSIPNNITSIGSGAFYYCSSLTSIAIPNNVTSIGDSAFYGCSSLTSIAIPDSVTSIGNCTFSGCSSLTSITIPNSVTSIGDSTFSSCRRLTNITIPNSVTSIGDYTFYNCNSLQEMTLPFIGGGYLGYLFGAGKYSENSKYVPTSLKKVTITKATGIGDYAFYHCSSLKEVSISNNVTSIGKRAFEDCSGLTSITIPDSVTSIGNSAFSGCSGLTSITIPNSVTSIGNYAFYGCYRLIEVYNLSSLNIEKWSEDNGHVGYYAKDIYSSLDQHSKLKTSNGVVYYINGTEKIAVAPEDMNATRIVIDNDCTKINQYAFSNCSSLISVTIPNNVTSIGDDAFSYCSSLTNIIIPNSVTSIGEQAFSNCSGLTNVYYTGTIENWCNITFSYNSNPMCYASQFYIKNSNGEYEELTEIEIPNTVTEINDYAFYGFNKVTKVTIPNSVTSIGGHAFENCSSLTNITIPDSVTSIGDEAFCNCSGLTSITIPNSVKRIGNYAFCGCSSLTSITIPNSVTSIGDRAFNGCSSLTSITIPDSVTRIVYSTFYDCSSLTSITIGNSVTSIGRYAFYGCSSLKKVYYNGTSSDWNKISIYSYNSNLTSATRYYYSETKPTESGNYWHYDTDGTTILEW